MSRLWRWISQSKRPFADVMKVTNEFDFKRGRFSWIPPRKPNVLTWTLSRAVCWLKREKRKREKGDRGELGETRSMKRTWPGGTRDGRGYDDSRRRKWILPTTRELEHQGHCNFYLVRSKQKAQLRRAVPGPPTYGNCDMVSTCLICGHLFQQQQETNTSTWAHPWSLLPNATRVLFSPKYRSG